MSNKNKILLRCLGYIAFAAMLVWWVLSPPRHRHSSFEAQRASQRKLAQQRVQSAGGWAMLAADCRAFVEASHTDYFQWAPLSSDTKGHGSLPKSIVALKPDEIFFKATTNSPTVVQIKLFGLHRSGGWDVPYYGLWVVCGSATPDYVPPITEGLARSVARITNEIFEAHQ